MIQGRITSIESMGLVDGPGIRAVVFFAGCSIRCLYCHNPETWCATGGQAYTPDAVIKKLLRFRPYFERGGGGVTFSGGEPLLQPEFLLELLKKCRELGIHTCLDTAGFGFGEYDEILSYTDLVLYDVKAITEEGYRKICGGDIKQAERFIRALEKNKTETIVRQVVIPGINDTDEYMAELREYIEKNIPTATSVELLPYHTLGSHKYKKLGITEPLADTPPMSEEKCSLFREKYFKDINKIQRI